MKKRVLGAALLCAAGLPMSVVADNHEADETYIYATYMYCDTTRQDEADKIFEDVHKPILEAAVKDGTITGWGWLVHHTGGKWRRIRYHSAGSMEALLAGLDTVGERIADASGDDDAFGQICNGHDDYIWRSVAGSGGDVLGQPRGKVGISTYHRCKMYKEDRADELVKSVFAKHYDANVGDGKLRSWGWSEHIVGGEYRRLSTMTADDWPTLLKMRAAIFESFSEEDNALADSFAEICPSHADYLWEIGHEG
jgi:hypothetical protein